MSTKEMFMKAEEEYFTEVASLIEEAMELANDALGEEDLSPVADKLREALKLIEEDSVNSRVENAYDSMMGR